MFIKLRVHPGERRDKIMKKTADTYEIWTKAKPERGLANASAIRQLSLELKVDARKIMLVKGAQSSSKIVKII
ncbi:MAG TPA: DUF167 domain-containing protein [Elusimicrobiales bacterium]|nr:DUF167 domain-containing protein [Elusimicrobiales bacterium]